MSEYHGYSGYCGGRKTSKRAWLACVEKRRFTCKNTLADARGVRLFNTWVVERLTPPDGPREEARFRLATGGWNTPTTRDRLKPFVRSIWTHRNVLYVNGEMWDGASRLVVNYDGDIVEVGA